MASGAKKGGGGGDVVLESRHLVGLFLMMVVIFGVVFVLGYELGRNQMSGQVRASDASAENTAASSAPPGGSAIVPPAVSGPVINPAASPAAPNRSASAPSKAPSTSPKNGNAKSNPLQPPASTPAANNSTKSGSKPPSAPPAKTVAPKSQPVAPANNRTAQPPSSALRSSPGAANAPLIPKGSVVLQVSALTVESDALKMAQELQQKKFPAFVLAPGVDHFYRVQVGPFADAKSADKARAALEKEGFKPIVKH